MSTQNKRRPRRSQIKQAIQNDVANKTQVKDNRSFIRKLISDDNDINEMSIGGFVAFGLFVIIVVADVVAPSLNISDVYIGHLITLIISFFGIGGGVKGFKALSRKVVSYEIPED